jgi:hypothetical protein
MVLNRTSFAGLRLMAVKDKMKKNRFLAPQEKNVRKQKKKFAAKMQKVTRHTRSTTFCAIANFES